MTLEPIPSAAELAAYLEARGEMVKPANLHLLRLAKLREARSKISPEEYLLRAVSYTHLTLPTKRIV